MPRTRRSLLAACALVVVLLAGSCGDDDTSADTPADDPAAAAAAALAAAGGPTTSAAADTDDATDDEPVQLDPTSIRGEIIDQYALGTDDCFDRLEDLRAGRPVVITTRLGCDEPHHFQIFAELSYPAEHPTPYPGDDVMFDFALRSCYQRFPEWVGARYELSELDIGVITPTRENFENDRARYRGIHCWVEHVDSDELTATMRGSGR